jgi:hypothetical protein
MNTEQSILLAERGTCNTSHILHLILSLITMGIWIVPWVIIAVSNKMERTRIDSRIRSIATDDIMVRVNNS